MSAVKTEKKPAETIVPKSFDIASKTMALKPRMSEKTYAQSHAVNTYAFDVPKTANKIEVARAVSSQFKVTVEDVRIAIIKGKMARSIRIGGTRKAVSGKRPDIKKAYVRIKSGETIPIFASIDEAEEKAKKAEAKAAKKASTDKPDKASDKTISKAKTTAKKSAQAPKKSPKPAKTIVEEKKEEILKPKSRFNFLRRGK